MSLRDDFKIKKMSYSVTLSLKGRLEKDGKKSDIVQKGGEGLSLNHSFEFFLKE